MTHKDTTMLEQLARTLEPRAWAALNSGDTFASKCRRISSLRKARAILNELKTPTEGMVKAARKKYFAPTHVNGLDGVIADIITGALDHVLNEGEGK